MITYFKNQIDLAESLKLIVDNYWAMEVEEVDLIKFIKQVKENNNELLFKGDDYPLLIKQKLGVKRLRLLDKVLGRNI